MSKARARPATPASKLEIGWREIIALPDWGVASLNCKIDTGARTSALHAVDVDPFDEDGEAWVKFHLFSKGVPGARLCTAKIHDRRDIKNTSGVPETRYIVQTALVLGNRRWRIEVSLADRENMEFDLILGRTALKGRRILINPGRSFLAGPPSHRPRKKRRPATQIAESGSQSSP